MTNELMSKPQHVFDNADTFETAQRMAKALSTSTFVPKEYKNNISNTLIALELASRTKASVFMIMQNLYIVHGRPSWSSQFIIAAINSNGRFSPLQFKITKDKKEKELTYNFSETTWSGGQKNTQARELKRKFINITCVAHATDKYGETYESPPISIEMARLEGWYDKKGSKWQTMPELMLRYRAASAFGRLYTPEMLMGLSTDEEARELEPVKDITPSNTETLTKRFDTPKEAQPEPVVVAEKVVNIVSKPPKEMADRTKDDLKTKANELIKLVNNGGDKVNFMQAFGGIEFLAKLTVAGLEEEIQNIREL